ncbi:hypothetical protein G6F46_002324 [Rhizopus delemar]|uniref:Non-structural maintenance of chromosomes element 4 n=2 Tax=Rhizopus TaxID=4842 RepID=A0A9P6Z8R9_9FUNG|nr:hypothetical protein G6F55_002493 [Rhizopus delemar]KAG1545647.1 hypothetical protein G6F51_005345 [Rhizopus arrhizus]KAG1499244.1 hypothetical protein G6F54_004531 [Rhizopus delemar]KAG1512999.1 hypothetical protein G6F53_004766 [Rhizopus delemar]KAG1527349.1 hypothetical protein G6F52_001615 [Rhizopus delemar]
MSLSKDQGLREVQEYLSKETDVNQYDPNQDQDERRRLRKSYRELTDKTLGKQSIRSFNLILNPQEAVLDSRLLAISADMNTQKARNLKIGTDTLVNLDEFVSKIISFSREGTNHEEDEFLDWEHIGKNAIHFGPLAVEQKQIKKARSTRITKNKEDLVIPAQLKESDLQEQENETSKNVNDIYKILSEIGPINYFKFVTNPESFSQTVENIFYVSFLARKAVVAINVESGQPILSTRAPPSVENLDDVVNKKQIVVGIDMKEWREIIETYKITSSYIPTRRKKQDLGASKNKWY